MNINVCAKYLSLYQRISVIEIVLEVIVSLLHYAEADPTEYDQCDNYANENVHEVALG